MSVDNKDVVGWMTVKGNHIPIRKGQNKEQAMISFLSQSDDSNLFQDRTKDIKAGKALTKKEYAIFCEKLGEIERGGYVQKSQKGEKYIPLEVKDDFGKIQYKIAVASGTFSTPKLKRVFTFKESEDMYAFLSAFEE